jgi:hypothetical protein
MKSIEVAEKIDLATTWQRRIFEHIESLSATLQVNQKDAFFVVCTLIVNDMRLR